MEKMYFQINKNGEKIEGECEKKIIMPGENDEFKMKERTKLYRKTL